MNDRILTLIKDRMAKGRVQYGHGLKEDSGYDWVKEALEEALDLSIYVSARLIEVKSLELLLNKCDVDCTCKCRSHVGGHDEPSAL